MIAPAYLSCSISGSETSKSLEGMIQTETQRLLFFKKLSGQVE